MNTRTASLILSATAPAQFPPPDRPEIAFAGRSNVGKSSLINALVGVKNLARVSATPGRTQAINFFEVSEAGIFVDLPGYGFAKVPPSVQASWRALIEAYLVDRVALEGVVLIVDIRHEPKDMDLQLLEFLQAHEIPVLIVATKADKLSRQQADKALAAMARGLNLDRNLIVRFSSETLEGRSELWKELNKRFAEGNVRMKEVRVEREKEFQARKAARASAGAPPAVVTKEDGRF